MKLPDLKKALISEIVAESDCKMVMGGDEELNLLNALSTISKILRN